MRQDFITVEGYQTIILYFATPLFTWQSNLPGMSACRYWIDRCNTLGDNVPLESDQKFSQVQLFPDEPAFFCLIPLRWHPDWLTVGHCSNEWGGCALSKWLKLPSHDKEFALRSPRTRAQSIEQRMRETEKMSFSFRPSLLEYVASGYVTYSCYVIGWALKDQQQPRSKLK